MSSFLISAWLVSCAHRCSLLSWLLSDAYSNAASSFIFLLPNKIKYPIFSSRISQVFFLSYFSKSYGLSSSLLSRIRTSLFLTVARYSMFWFLSILFPVHYPYFFHSTLLLFSAISTPHVPLPDIWMGTVYPPENSVFEQSIRLYIIAWN